MKKIKVLSVFGTRPEAIKMAPLALELARREEIESLVCVTAQHRQMLDQVLSAFGITPDFDLDIMQERQTLSGITGRALSGISDVLEQAKPDIVLVHGDTTTTFAGALAAFYHKIKIGHVEAGLRTFNNYSPYPEEVNRRMTGVVADLHFAPTTTNKKNLLREGVEEDRIFITGNTVIDALANTVREDYEFREPLLNSLDFKGHRVVLLTAHRRENLGEPLENICRAIKNVAGQFEDLSFVYPVHLNPVVQEVAREILGDLQNVVLTPPLEVLDLHNVMARCYMVMTDSGGLQEEAPSLGKPVLVLRTETERPEAVESGTVQVVGVDQEAIEKSCIKLLTDEVIYNKMAQAINPYGDGKASIRIADAIFNSFT